MDSCTDGESDRTVEKDDDIVDDDELADIDNDMATYGTLDNGGWRGGQSTV